MKLSGIVIAKNSEDLISDCLASLSFCDEIIVVDGGSTDDTVAVAKKYTQKVIKGVDGNFARQREIGLQYAKGEWVLYIDTDERVTNQLKKNILAIIEEQIKDKDYSFSGYKIERKNFYFGNHPWPNTEFLERLFLRSHIKGWKGALHESPIVEGKIGQLTGELLHYTHRDLTSMLTKTIIWSDTEAELRFHAHHPYMSSWRFYRILITGFYDSYIHQKGWRAGTAGIVEGIYQSFSFFITYAKLWELQMNKTKK